MLDVAPLSVRPPEPLPIAQMVVGKRAEEVAALLPRIFNLCREAQALAVHMALGLPYETEKLAQEITRDHLMKLGLILPKALGLPALPIATGGAAFWGVRCPQNLPELRALMASGHGLGPLLKALDKTFVPGEACASLPPVTDWTALTPRPLENSVAQRRSAHPLMVALENEYGRGPLWRVVGRMLDLEACYAGNLPKPRKLDTDAAQVPAARGSYAIRLTCTDGIVLDMTRITPTDHLLAKGGVMDQSLATLRPENHGLAPLIVDILDPCSPVELIGGIDA